VQHPLRPQTIELSLAPSPRHRARVEINPLGRAATTTVISCVPHGELFVVEARAGRAYRHQVRAHLAAVGSPIVGDALYGGAFGARHYLHALSMAFAHPITGEAIALRADPPDDWPSTAG
jgi:23S rRNA pseudouridine1911/1915/1917 synthase